jgi:hypothetical protein
MRTGMKSRVLRRTVLKPHATIFDRTRKVPTKQAISTSREAAEGPRLPCIRLSWSTFATYPTTRRHGCHIRSGSPLRMKQDSPPRLASLRRFLIGAARHGLFGDHGRAVRPSPVLTRTAHRAPRVVRAASVVTTAAAYPIVERVPSARPTTTVVVATTTVMYHSVVARRTLYPDDGRRPHCRGTCAMRSSHLVGNI